MKANKRIEFISPAELAKLLNISRVAIFNKIRKGEIKAHRVGRSFVIVKSELPSKIQIRKQRTRVVILPKNI